MPKGEQKRAALLSKKDRRAPAAATSDLDTSSDSDVDRTAVAEAKKKRDRELKLKVTATEEDNKALDRQLADAEAKKKAKLAQLAALRNSYPVT